MNSFGKIVVFLIVVTFLFWLKFDVYDKYFADNDNAQTRAKDEAVVNEEKTVLKKDENAKQYVSVYFLYVKPNGENVFAKIQRELPENENRLPYAIKELLKGPNADELSKKYYSEIPNGTKSLSIMENNDKVIINLSSDFQYGGGSDSLYSRVQQLLKTVVANTSSKNVYLYLDGQQADVIGGEGLMIKQPLQEDSLFDD